MNSVAASFTLFRLAKSRGRKNAFLPVILSSSKIALSARSLLRHAIYTLALRGNKALQLVSMSDTEKKTDKPKKKKFTLAVAFPIPVFAPVTMTTFPVRSGISSADHVGRGMKKLCLRKDQISKARRSAQKRDRLIDEKIGGYGTFGIKITRELPGQVVVRAKARARSDFLEKARVCVGSYLYLNVQQYRYVPPSSSYLLSHSIQPLTRFITTHACHFALASSVLQVLVGINRSAKRRETTIPRL
jgi:hypothetical protein